MSKKQYLSSLLGCLLALLMFALPLGQGFVAYKHAEKITQAVQEQSDADKAFPHAGKITMLSQASSHTGFASIHHWPLAEWPSFNFELLSPSEALSSKAPVLGATALDAFVKALMRYYISPQAP